MPWCPQCHMEYRPGFERCSDCHIGLVEQQPEGAGITVLNSSALFDVLGVRRWMLLSALFMFAFSALERQLRAWLFESLGSFVDTYFFYYATAPPSRPFILFMDFALPILLNLLFFCGAFFIVRKLSPLRYLTLRNAGIVAGISVGGILALRLLSLLWLFIQFGGDPARNPDLIFNAREISMGVVYAHVLVHILLTVLPLALIYRYTIGGLPLKKLLLGKTAIGALAISFILFALAYIYTAHFFDGHTVTLPTPPFGINARWFFMLHLLWAGLLVKEPAPKSEDSEPQEEPAAP